MPSLSLVTQAGAPNSSATATLVQDFTAVAPGGLQTSQILQTQALPKLYFWFNVTAGGPVTITPQFAVRGETAVNLGVFEPDPLFLDLGGSVVHPGVGSPPQLLIFEFPAVYIRLQFTFGGAANGDCKLILAASV